MATALFYNCDLNFLYPTLVSILSLRRYVKKSDCHIYVGLEHGENFDVKSLNHVTNKVGVTFISVGKHMEYGSLFGDNGGNRIPPITLLKFQMFDLVSSSIDRLIYLDPDTLVNGNIKELLDWPVKSGTIGVVEDALSFYDRDWTSNGKFARSYKSSLGLRPGERYFNAGVILSDRQTWARVSNDSVQYFKNNMERCIYLDQSAMNAAVSKDKTHLSPVWNYQSRFKFWGNVPELTPKIYHFTGAMKAWLGRLEPWLEVHDDILDLSKRIAVWGFDRPSLSPDLVLNHNRQFSSSMNRLRRSVDYRLFRRRERLKYLHREAHA